MMYLFKFYKTWKEANVQNEYDVFFSKFKN